MSGGHFDYQQYNIERIAEDVETLVENNDDKEYPYSRRTINEFKRAIPMLREAYVYAQRIDWLVSGDDSEETFHKRLQADLMKL